jgi:hypothetical protein
VEAKTRLISQHYHDVQTLTDGAMTGYPIGFMSASPTLATKEQAISDCHTLELIDPSQWSLIWSLTGE